MDYSYMGQQIRHYRRERKMSRNDLAAAIGVSAAYVGHIERGSRHASLETVVAISRCLNVSLDVLIFPHVAASTSAQGSGQLVQIKALLKSAEKIIDGMATTAGDSSSASP